MNVTIYLWIDPGGESGHGVSFAVVMKHKGIYYILDLLVVRQDLPKCAESLYQLLETWDVDFWGVEGNFSQAQFFGKGLYRELERYIYDNEKDLQYLIYPLAAQNTSHKIQRIRAGFTKILGLETTPYTCYINHDAQSFDRFNLEVITFGTDVKPSQKHEFDLLDSIVSCDLHMIKSNYRGNKQPVVYGAGGGYHQEIIR